MNNVPFDRPIANRMQFSQSSYPQVNLNLPPELLKWVGAVASLLLNTAGERCNENPARMASLNNLYYNNFNNSFYNCFVEVSLKLAAKEAMLQRQPMNIGAFITKSVNEALMFLASLLMAKTPEMQRYVEPRVVNAAYENFSIFERVVADLKNLNLNVYSQNQSIYQQPSNPVAQAPIFSNYSHSYASAHQPPNNSESTFGSQWDTVPIATPSLTNNYSELTLNSIPDFKVMEEKVPVMDYGKTSKASNNFIESKSFNQTKNVVNCHGENEMDINNHAVPYFGAPELLDLSARKSDLQLEVLQLSREGRREEDYNGPVLLEKSISTEINLDSAIFTATVSKANNLYSSRQNQVYRQFLHIVSPTACSPEGRQAMNIFKKAPTLDRVPELFKNFLKVIKDPTNPQENELQALNFYSYLNKKLCESVNEFLKYNLRVDTIITSFAEDYASLQDHLAETESEQHANAFRVWGVRFLDQLKNGYNEKAEEFLSGFFAESCSASIGYFPTFQSLTLVSLTYQELGYKIAGGENCALIDPKMTNVLDSITQSLYRNKKDLNVTTSKDWLITADDQRFRLAEDALNTGKFYLFPQN